MIGLILLGVVLAATGGILLRARRQEARFNAAFPPQGTFVEVDGVRLHAVVQGNGPDIVLIHGASGSTRDMTFSLAGKLAADYRVIAFDRPGLGWSGRAVHMRGVFNPKAESPAEQAALMAKAARALGAERPILMGHSYGGAVALAWALEHDTAGLVLVGSVTNPWPGGLGAHYRYLGSGFFGGVIAPLVTALARPRHFREAVRSLFRPSHPPKGYAAAIGAPLSARRATLRANARQVNTLFPHIVDMSARYGALLMPVEILHGDHDDIVPLAIHALPLSAQIPHANLCVLKGAGHMPHHTHERDVIAAAGRVAKTAGLR